MNKSLRVLIVEDSEDDALLLIRELRRNNYEPVYTRVDTPEAMIAALDEQTWDIIFSDYIMPRFSGLNALKLMQDKGLDLPFIIVSGKIGEDIAVEAMKAGAHDYVMKDRLARLAPAVERELREAEVRQKRKLAEKALRESEEKYRSIFENSGLGIFQTTLDGKLIGANPAIARMFGFESPKEAMAILTDLATDIYVNPPERIETLRKAMESDVSIRAENQYRRRDGSIMTCDLMLRAVRDDAGNVQYFEGFMEDVTERKRSEEALKNSERRLADIISFLPDATLAIDREGRVIAWNRAMEEMTGTKAEEMLGKNDYEYGIPFYGKRRPLLLNMVLKPIEEVEKLYTTVTKMGDTLSAEAFIPNLKPGGVYLWFTAIPLYDVRGEVVGAIESIRDITERKQIEAALRESEERYRVLVQYAPEAIIVYDVDMDQLVDANENAERLFGCSRDVLLGYKIQNFYPTTQPDGRPVSESMHDYSQRALAGEEAVFERFIHNAEGKDIISEVRLVRLPSTERKLIRGSFIDVTERKHAEERQRQFEQRIEEQKRHFYKDTILSVTNGKLEICETEEIEPYITNAMLKIDADRPSDIGLARHQIEVVLEQQGLEGEQLNMFMLGIGEAITNAVKHAQQGQVYVGTGENSVWTAISDQGKGIEALVLPKSVLLAGFSTKPSMGIGYTIMLDVSDHVLLKTDRYGTTVVLIKNIIEPSLDISLEKLPDTWKSISSSVE